MHKKLHEIDEIMKIKEDIACGRDVFRDFSRYLHHEIQLLSSSFEKKYCRIVEEKITNYSSIFNILLESINDTIEIIKPINDQGALEKFLNISRKLIDNIKKLKELIKKHSTNIIHRFKGIHLTCDKIIISTNKIKIFALAK